MPVIRINADGATPALHGAPHPLGPTLERALANPGPIVVMVHGYKFRPYDPVHCPHTHIFSLGDTNTCPKALSWPRHLGFGRGNRNEGLAIAFGWQARGSLWQARDSAERAAIALADLVARLRRIAPQRPINIIAHSLGAHLSLTAIRRMQAGDLGRVILLNGAAYRGLATTALESAAGQACELFNVVSHENALYDSLFECVLRPDTRHDRALGRGFSAPNALTLRLDAPATLARLAALGFPVAARAHWHCHWSTYLRPGVFPLYQGLLRTPERTPLRHLEHLLSTPAPTPPSQESERGWKFPTLSLAMKQAS